MPRTLRAFLLVFIGYLFQACVMPHLSIGGITADLLFSVIAIATVAYGRFYSFGMSCVAGILMEAMTAGLPNLNLVGYAAIGQLGGLIFADKSERRLEQERSQGRSGKNSDPRLRTVLCTLFDIAVFEAINLMFVYLNGVDLGWTQFSRAFGSIVYTTGVTILLMLPLRWLLGIHRQKAQADKAA